MRKSTLLVLVFSLSLASLSVVNVLGHAPAALTLTYSTETQELSVNITHNVANANTHYISTVEITKNSETPEVYPYTSQPTLGLFTYEYPLVANPGDSITVKITCVLGGERTSTLNIPNGTSSTTPPSSQGIPGYLGWIIMISGGVSILFLVRFYRIRAMKRD